MYYLNIIYFLLANKLLTFIINKSFVENILF